MENFRRSSAVGSHKSTGKNPIGSALSAIATCFSFPPEKGEIATKKPPPGLPISLLDDELGFLLTNLSIAETSGSPARSDMLLSRRAISQSCSTTECSGRSFTMAEIRAATGNFSSSCKIGQGGFGTVYKGMLANGTVVAIKRAKKVRNSGFFITRSVFLLLRGFFCVEQGFRNKQLGLEFKRETQILATIEHLNLVRLYGYLEHEDEKVVVLEYVSNGTLREHLDCR